MVWVEVVTVLAVFQLFFFSFQVGRAHTRYGVKLPAMTGNETFERYNRVHMNTLEIMMIFLPSLWIAAQHWNPAYMAGVGAVYLVGRVLFFIGYTKAVEKRGPGFALSMLPALALLLLAIIGIIRSLIG